ncbi:MAG: HEXXH motif-containing putative peptide modification protein [Actinomycetota bacterium]
MTGPNSFASIFDLELDATESENFRTRYHAQMISDLGRFVEATPGSDRDLLSAVTRLQGHQVSPGIAVAHARFEELTHVGEPVESSDIEHALHLLREALEDGPTRHGCSVGTLDVTQRWHDHFLALCSHEYEKAVDFYPNAVQRAEARPLPSVREAECKSIISSVLSCLAEAAPSIHGDIVALLSDVIVFEGEGFTGASAPSFFGAVLVREPPSNGDEAWVWFAEHLTHEASHQRMLLACAMDPLVATETLVTSPIRKDPRPLSGVVHALWVETRLAQAFDALVSIRDRLPIKDTDRIEQKLDEFDALRVRCVDIVSNHRQRLSAAGRDVLDACASLQVRHSSHHA